MDKRLIVGAASFLILLAAVYFNGPAAGSVAQKLNVKSPVFSQGERIPVKYTCDGENVSPPVSWSPGPATTRAYALIMDDPDAPGTFTHWVLFNLPANTTSLAEQVSARERLDDGALQGKNDFGGIGYGGPCPPAGKPHHYHFRVYALDTMLSQEQGASKAGLLRAMNGHVLAEGELVGIYGR